MPVLTNSDRHLLKATHTPITFDQLDAPPPSRAHDKAAFARSLQLQPGEVDALRQGLRSQAAAAIPDAVWDVLRQFEPPPVGGLAPKASVLADVPVDHLMGFGQALLDRRTANLAALTSPPTAPDSSSPAAPRAAQARAAGALAAVSPDRLLASSLVTFARGALNLFTNAVQVSPIGMLHLERVEMAPAGVERGELIATIPLAPQETTAVVQKEWAVTSQEFSSIVTDSLENYSEKGVTEKGELAEATESQSKHSQQLGLDASLTGSYGFVTFSTSTKFDLALSGEESKRASRKHASEVTGKASARVRKERKVTIQTSSVTGKEETTTRILSNPSTTDGMRIDYYSMMRKWRVRLFEYGLRLTYDLAIPEPGATLRKLHAQLAGLEAKLSTPFRFDLEASDVKRDNYQQHANTFGVSVPAPPQEHLSQRIGGPVQGLGKVGDDEGWHFFELEVNVPDGYYIASVWLDAMIGNVNNDPLARHFSIFGCDDPPGLGKNGQASFVVDLSGFPGFLKNRTGNQKIVYFLQNVDAAAVTFTLTFEPTAETMAQWQSAAWQALYNAAHDAYYTSLQALTQQRDALKAHIEGVDTLTLRREERDEVMKGILRWLLGPAFDFMPQDVVNLFAKDPTLRSYGESFTGNDLGLDASGWSTMFVYQEMVKFIQQAIEWENMLYFLYPYFWDVPAAWDFVRTLQHPDATRQQFLRAGSARVVLTIRSGFENAFAAFVDRGELGRVLPPDHPYLTIGREIRAYDRANYPGIPPANPAEDFRPLLTPLQRQAWQDMQGLIALLEQYKIAKGAYPTTGQGLAELSELGSVPASDPWGNPYVYRSPGAFNDYELASLGADGQPGGDGEDADITSWAGASLIAEWFEYTPTHGTDIQINSAPASMA
jgi:hypothetical protein